MPFVFTDKVGALKALIARGDPAAERFARELIADRDHSISGVAGLVELHLARGELNEARLYADRLTRVAPSRLDFATLNAAIALRLGRYDDALRILEKVQRFNGLDATILRIGLQAAIASDSGSKAWDLARRLAKLGAPDPQSMSILDQACMLPDRDTGWMAATMDGGVVGSVPRPLLAAARMAWSIAGASRRVVDLARGAILQEAGPVVRFELARADLPEAGRLSIEAQGTPFFGSPLQLPARPLVLGCVEERFGEAFGWAWAPGSPETILSVRATDRSGSSREVLADGGSPSAQRLVGARESCGFRLENADGRLAPGPVTFTAAGVSLSGSPLPLGRRPSDSGVLASFRRAAASSQTRPGEPAAAQALAQAPIAADARGRRNDDLGRAEASRGQAVLVPVYDGRDETLACLSSVIGSVPAGTKILVVDDASPDPLLSDALAELAACGAIALIRNDVNLGYPRSVNRGLSHLAGYDVALLNADALVANDWLGRLAHACHRSLDIGTVTALAPSGSIASYGSHEKERTAADVAEIDCAARDANWNESVEAPTGVGHCLFISAACLADVGLLDDVTFGRGYGEENDFCLRARARGWRNMIAADVFVGHIGERSFGIQRRILSHRNGAILERLYPGYDAMVARHVAADPLASARRRIDLRRLRSAAPATLIVTMGWKGGVATHVEERARQLQAEGKRALILQPIPPSPGDPRRRCRLIVEDQPDLEDLVFERREFDELVLILRDLRIAFVEFHHTLHHHPRVLELPRLLNAAYGIVVHDYSWICPRMALVDGSGSYCGVPDAPTCDRCVASYGSISDDPVTVGELRARSRALFEAAASVVAPCRDVADRLAPHIGHARPVVVPWDRSAPGSQARTPSKRLRVVTPGGIGLHKGFAVLKACAEDAKARALPIDFIVIGYSEDDHALLSTGRVFITGEFEPAELPGLLDASGAELAFLPSICPETWSYTLSEVWSNGLEALAFDIGAIAERIRLQGGGKLLPLGTTAAAVNDFLLDWKRPHLPQAPQDDTAFRQQRARDTA